MDGRNQTTSGRTSEKNTSESTSNTDSENGKILSLTTNDSQAKAIVWGIGSSLIALPFFYAIWWVVGLHIYFAAGGTLGGYGAAAEPGNASWQYPLLIVAAIALLLLDICLGIFVYRKKLKKLSGIN